MNAYKANSLLFQTAQRRFSLVAQLKVQKAQSLKERPEDLANSTDHMLNISWQAGKGWGTPEIKPYGPIKIPTTATSLHYGVSCFDGFIVARNIETGKLQAQDLDQHLNRMNRASAHLDLQELDTKELKTLITELLKVEDKWIPQNGS